MAATHDVFNQVTPLADVNLFAGNQALQDALKFNAPGLNTAPLAALGQLAGSAAMQNHARLANVHTPDLLRVTQLLTRNQHDVARAYRRMLFNVAAHNRDDHGKNFAFLMTPAGEWSLSPAFDLCPSSGPGGEHSTSVMGEGRNPTREHCLALAGRAGLRAAQARFGEFRALPNGRALLVGLADEHLQPIAPAPRKPRP